jgi:hypothetical protein
VKGSRGDLELIKNRDETGRKGCMMVVTSKEKIKYKKKRKKA